MNAKRKISKKKDGGWDTSDLYRSGKSPFDIEWMKFYNEAEGKTQIIFLYKSKLTGKICKYRMLR
jgi:hypothetical protein